ncbi:MAG: efflux RND transporter periplasmic adaptor subunit [Thermodesulfobacteriota bacterium]|nr:efflux RND transporter periplasmic adaptor subunit [Thermodesulfobacteriota bacterium]
MKKKSISFITIIIIISAAVAFWFFLLSNKENPPVKYLTAKVERGEISLTVSATGTINATSTVEVGSQISGIIQRLLVDFNSEVEQQQIIALIDQAPFKVKVKQAEANLAAARAAVHIAKAEVKNYTATIENARALEEAARAEIESARVALSDAERVYTRTEKLYKKQIVSKDNRDSSKAVYDSALAKRNRAESNYEATSSKLRSAEAQLEVAKARFEQAVARKKQAKAGLESAELDMDHTVIRSPVNGIVISRNVDVGQTVAASFQAPVLFLIAEDLSQMQVEANVSEADIGRLRVDQEALFTVDAYPDENFRGKVIQIRNAPITVQNVVTYNVIIEVDNRSLRLKPGMTADVSIIIDKRDQVLRIPNTALRFKPESGQKTIQDDGEQKISALGEAALKKLSFALGLSDDQVQGIKDIFKGSKDKIARLRADRRSGMDIRDRAEGLRMNIRQQIRMLLTEEQRKRFDMIIKARDSRRKAEEEGRKRKAVVWRLDPDGTPQSVSVVVGIADEVNTEIISGDLEEMDQVITGIIKSSKQSKGKSFKFMFRRF